MLTYAGSSLLLINEFLLPRIQRWWDISAPDLWSYPGYALEGMHHLPVPDRPKTPNRARLNVLYWPTGASRWGVFHGLVDIGAATAIQTATGGYGSSPVPADLILQDTVRNSTRTVTASMFLLAIRPVFVLSNEPLYWITLVDRRYYYWLRDPVFSFDDGDDWSDLLSALTSAAGSPPHPTPHVHPDYGKPNYLRWNLSGKPLPLLIDAAARQVGLRYTITLDGTASAFVDYSTAKTASDQMYNDVVSAQQLVLGGENTKILTTATGSALSMIGNIPANVVVKFWSESGGPNTYTTQTIALDDLALPEYSGLSGVPDTYGIIMADQENSVTSPSKSVYATQAATDYYLWLLSRNEFVATSIFGFESSGLEDRIEWEYLSPREANARSFVGVTSNSQADIRDTRPIRLLTRVVPFDWHDNAIYGGNPLDSNTSPNCCPNTSPYSYALVCEPSSGSGSGSGALGNYYADGCGCGGLYPFPPDQLQDLGGYGAIDQILLGGACDWSDWLNGQGYPPIPVPPGVTYCIAGAGQSAPVTDGGTYGVIMPRVMCGTLTDGDGSFYTFGDGLRDVQFELAYNFANSNSGWTINYASEDGTFRIGGVLRACPNREPGLYLVGYVYNANDYDPDAEDNPYPCGCYTRFPACPEESDDPPSQEIQYFFPETQSVALKINTPCGSFSIRVGVCDPEYTYCCTLTPGIQYLLTIPDGPAAGQYRLGANQVGEQQWSFIFSNGNTATMQCENGVYRLFNRAESITSTTVACDPFAVVFPPGFGSTGAITIAQG